MVLEGCMGSVRAKLLQTKLTVLPSRRGLIRRGAEEAVGHSSVLPAVNTKPHVVTGT